jgi:hypothetical protein
VVAIEHCGTPVEAARAISVAVKSWMTAHPDVISLVLPGATFGIGRNQTRNELRVIAGENSPFRGQSV